MSTPAPKRRPRTPKNAFALPARPENAPPVPAFAPVPRATYRHDGWTPERQRAFIAALADTGCVSRAARMVNVAQTNCYTLRRSPGAEEFRAAWDAALDCGLAQMKDIAFERAIEGELIPVFAGGKHMGFRRKRNDALLMFVLRHYGKDAAGKRTTINYFSSRASARASTNSAAANLGGSLSPAHPELVEGCAGAEASATTVTTVITGSGGGSGEDGAARQDRAAALVEGFEGLALDEEARAEIMAALSACALREQAVEAAWERTPYAGFELAADNPAEDYLTLPSTGMPYHGTLEPPGQYDEAISPEGEDHWALLGQPMPE